jgi:hypothetical protein
LFPDWLSSDEEDESSPEEELSGEDLDYISKLYTAMGRCSLLLMDKEKAAASFDSCINVSFTTIMLPDFDFHRRPMLTALKSLYS